MKPSQIVVCGDSLYLEAIAEGLFSQVAIAMTRVDLRDDDALRRITALAPDAILIEAQPANEHAAFALLQQGFALVVLDAEESIVTVIEGRQTPASGLADLMQVIRSLGGANVPEWVEPTVESAVWHAASAEVLV